MNVYANTCIYARKQLLLSARLSHRNSVFPSVRPSVRPSVCPSVTRADQSKTVQDRITKSSPVPETRVFQAADGEDLETLAWIVFA